MLLLVTLLCATVHPQGRTNSAYWSYINKYKQLAIQQQQKYKIPASITLAQGLLESGAGQSRLAKNANNHFGIKASGDWTGPYIRANDERRGEKFRKYKSVQESYEDHSRFLLKPRYSRLFTYRTTDYKAWAKGLKACGYATSSTYAKNLINIIELYSLHQYDTSKPVQQNVTPTYSSPTYSSPTYSSPTYTPLNTNARGKIGKISLYYLKRLSRNKIRAKKIPTFFRSHTVHYNNKNYYIVVQNGDDLASISRNLGLSVRELRKFNDLEENHTPKVGDILYMRKKRKNAPKEYSERPHRVQPGQSMYDISQIYGIRLKNLYKLNGLSPRTYQIKTGDLIWLR